MATLKDLGALASTAERKLLPYLAAIVLVAAILRVLFPGLAGRLDSTTLLYAVVAASLLLAKEIKSLTFGDYKVEFERTAELAQRALDTARDAQAVALESDRTNAPALPGAWAPSPGEVHDDPWKGVFGGHAEVDGRRLSARVSGANGWYTVDLLVESTRPKNAPLSGTVQFFLHDTFKKDRPVVSVNQAGEARLTLHAYGAFTVGAIADGGHTRLELDLAKLADVPQEFRER